MRELKVSVSIVEMNLRWSVSMINKGGGRREMEREKEGFKRFGDFEGRSVLSGCALGVEDGGCFGGF